MGLPAAGYIRDPVRTKGDIKTALENLRDIFGTIVTKTASYTALGTDGVILCDATAGAITITLPTIIGAAGKYFIIKKIDATLNAVTVDPTGAELIELTSTFVLRNQFDYVWLVSDGSKWYDVTGRSHEGATAGGRWYSKMYNFLDIVGTYTTIVTLTPSAVGGVFQRGLVKVNVCGQTDGIGNGTLSATWYFDISGATPTVLQIGTDETSGSYNPFKLVVSGNNILLQVRNNTTAPGTGNSDGTVFADIYCPRLQGGATWTLT